MNTKTYHGPPGGLPTGSTYGMGRQDVARLGEPDPRLQRSTSELGATKVLISRVMRLQAPEGLYIRR
jgi:hypothetical protein